MIKICIKLTFAAYLVLYSVSLDAQTKPRIQARLIWQDASDQSLKWGDLKKGEEWSLKANPMPGQPNLDEERHTFVQMQSVENIAVVGVRDDEDGMYQSGWYAIDSGVQKEVHGGHFHWRYTSPKIIKTVLDKSQGNPAHVYLYEDIFYIANDKKNGFTTVSPNALLNSNQKPDQFFEAGGGHITLAAIGGQVGYSTWIDREGDNKGRIDVVGLGSNMGRQYHIHLPSGGIHGATTNSGKVFFAPSDGICWIDADRNVTGTEATVDIHHVSLGETAEGSPKRTGAFENSGSHVLFTVGRSGPAELYILDASQPKPNLKKLSLEIAEGNSVTTPRVVRSRTGGHFAMLFEEDASGEQEEQLHIVSLDPNRDSSYDDAILHKSIPVGPSLIEGHSGHHEATALSRNLIAISNPGDGTIALLSTRNWEFVATLTVGGTPTRMVAFGNGQ